MARKKEEEHKQGSDWGGKQTGEVRKFSSTSYALEEHGNGSMDYESQQEAINHSDEKKLRRSGKSTMDSGH